MQKQFELIIKLALHLDIDIEYKKSSIILDFIEYLAIFQYLLNIFVNVYDVGSKFIMHVQKNH